MKYDIYQAEDGHKKKYLVFEKGSNTLGEGTKIAKRFFRCSNFNLMVYPCWVNGKDLYLSDPHMKGYRKCYAFAYYSDRRKK